MRLKNDSSIRKAIPFIRVDPGKNSDSESEFALMFDFRTGEGVSGGKTYRQGSSTRFLFRRAVD